VEDVCDEAQVVVLTAVRHHFLAGRKDVCAKLLDQWLEATSFNSLPGKLSYIFYNSLFRFEGASVSKSFLKNE